MKAFANTCYITASLAVIGMIGALIVGDNDTASRLFLVPIGPMLLGLMASMNTPSNQK